ncbi:MAG: hypothetical protein O2877_01675 [bacterium]|nr:hypothetical protein [bacterium]
MKNVLHKLFAGMMTFAMVFSLSPVLAQEPSLTSAETSVEAESIVVAPTDTPLERQAKLHRAWTVYREKGSTQIWAIRKEEKTKHEVQTLEFFSAFDANYHVLLVADGRLDQFIVGDPITSNNLNPEDWRKQPFRCRLVKAEENPAVYLVCQNKKRVVLREGVFHRFGWEFRDVEKISDEELSSFETDDEIDEETLFEEEVEVDSTEKRSLREQIKKRLELKGKDEVRARLIKQHDKPEVFVIMPNGKLRHIKSLEEARRHKLKLKETTEVSGDELEAFEIEDPEDEVDDDDFEDLLDGEVI